MANEKFNALSDDDLDNVTGGDLIQDGDKRAELEQKKCPNCGQWLRLTGRYYDDTVLQYDCIVCGKSYQHSHGFWIDTTRR